MKKSPLLVIFLTVFLNLMSFGLIIPLMPFYAQSFGANSLIIGSLTAVFSTSQLIFTPILGAFSDRLGRRPLILAGFLTNVLGFIILGLGGSLWVLFLGRAVNGLGSSSIGVAQAYIADVTTPENRAKGMGLIGAAFGLGFVLGPAFGGTLGSISLSLPFFFSAVIALLGFVLGWIFLDESLSPELRRSASKRLQTPFTVLQSIGRALLRPNLRLPILIFFLFNLAFTGFEVSLPLFTQHRFGYESRENGYLFAYMGVLVVIMQGGVVGLVVKRLGERRTLQMGLVLLAITLSLLPLSYWLLVLLGIMSVLAVGQGVTTPTSTAIISVAGDATEQGEVLGLSQGVSSLGRIIGPLLGGFVFGLNENWPFLVSAMIMAFTLFLALNLRGIKQAPETSSSEVVGVS
jgi:MFS transporter, DHA1 family, tetracycline resistance protein